MSIVPVTNDAPGLFSTTKPTPICADICCASTRIRMSTEPPAADGRIMRIGFSGYAASAPAMAPARATDSANFLSIPRPRLLGHIRGAALELGHRQILLVRGDVPDVAERILERAGAIAVELVLHRPDDLRAGGARARNSGVDVLHVHVDRHRRSAARLRAEEIHRGEFIREHDARTADPDLGVADRPARAGHAHDLLRAERLLVELDRVRGAADAEVRRDRVIAGWNRLDLLLRGGLFRRGLLHRFLALHRASLWNSARPIIAPG